MGEERPHPTLERPGKDIARKLRVQPELFIVAEEAGTIVGSVMAGYDGHRASMYYVAVDEAWRKAGIGRAMIEEVERLLRELGCPKVNLQVRGTNHAAAGFYTSLGYAPDDVLSFGKWLEPGDPAGGFGHGVGITTDFP